MHSLIKAAYYNPEMENVNVSLYERMQEDKEPNVEYSRYWHGGMVLLRPLFVFTGIEGARMILGIALFALPAAVSIILGGVVLALLDKIVPHMHNGTHQEEGPKSHFSKSMKLFFAVTLHNIPEGLASLKLVALVAPASSPAGLLQLATANANAINGKIILIFILTSI